MNINELMNGLVFASFGGYVGYGSLASQYGNEALKHVVGFVVNYDNGYFTVSGGGGAQGHDLSEFWLIDGMGNILWEDSYTN